MLTGVKRMWPTTQLPTVATREMLSGEPRNRSTRRASVVVPNACSLVSRTATRSSRCSSRIWAVITLRQDPADILNGHVNHQCQDHRPAYYGQRSLGPSHRARYLLENAEENSAAVERGQRQQVHHGQTEIDQHRERQQAGKGRPELRASNSNDPDDSAELLDIGHQR